MAPISPEQESKLRLFFRDALEAGLAAVSALWVGGALNAIPTADTTKDAVVAATFAFGAAVVAVARRELVPVILDAISKKGA